MGCKCSPAKQDNFNKKYKGLSNIPIFTTHKYNPCDSSYDASASYPSLICELKKRIESLEIRVKVLEGKVK